LRKLPPGPFRVPFIGNAFNVVLKHPSNPSIACHKLSKFYGDIIYIQFGLRSAVVVHGFESVQKIFHSDDFLERVDEAFSLDRTFGKPLGLVTGRLDIWKESRCFTLKTLKEFGFGVKSSMEASLQLELQELCDHISNKILNKQSIQAVGLFDAAVVNVVWSMVIGKRFSAEDPTMKHLVNLAHMFFEPGLWKFSLLLSYPFLAHMAPKLVGFDKQAKSTRGYQTFLSGVLARIRSEGKYLTSPDNFTEIFLQKIDTRQLNGTVDDIVYSDENLISILYDLLAGSSESAGKFLAFAILFAVLYPEVQEKVKGEIDLIIGSERLPELSDRERMPYTEATLHEIHRHSNLFGMIPAKVHKDTKFEGFIIPKGTHVMANMYSVSMDENFWGDPHNFRPDRFICPSTGKTINAERICPFGAGKRNCIAKHMAQATSFIIFAGLLQKFQFEINPAEGKPSAEVLCGLSNSPRPFSVIVKPRK
jgi:cytochrome P450